MTPEVRVFLDTSALFAAVHSESGGARLVLKLGEAGAASLWVGPSVLKEADAVIARKSPKSRAYFALLLDQAQVRVGKEASPETLEQARQVTDYLPDAHVLAEALTVGVDYLITFDREHLIANPRLGQLPFPVGAAGDFLEWYRKRIGE
ncbi:MAG: PIN domain-containing protein [Planctomycetota bacterium]